MNTSPTSGDRDRPGLAIIIRLFSAMAAALSFVIVKLAGSMHIGIAQVMFWRFIVCAVCLLAYLALRGQLRILRTRRLASHFGRGLNSTVLMGLNYWATMVIPIALVSTINFTAPLFAVLITALVLRQAVSRVHWFAVLIGFAGVVLVTRPSPSDNYPVLGALAALCGSACTSVSNLQVRDLSRTEQPLAIAFYFSLFGALLSAFALPFSAAPTQPIEWLLLVGLGLQGLAFQVLFAMSLRFGNATTVMVMDYSVLIWVTLAGWLIWDHLPGISTWLGAPLIVGAGLLIAWYTRRGQSGPASAAA